MMNYNKGLEILEAFVKRKEPDSLKQFDLAKIRLMEFSEQKNLFGKDVNAEIAEVIYYQLNPLARRITREKFSFSDLCQQSDYQQPGTPDNFDLDDLIDECDDILFGQRGLVGLGIHCSSRLFLTHFQTRLKRRLGINKVYASSLEDLYSLDIKTSLQRNVRIIRGHRRKLSNQDVLLDIVVCNENAATRFWQTITEEFKAQFNHRLIIVMMAVNSDLSFPKNVINVPSPCFKRRHVLKWVRTVVDRMPYLSVDDKENVVNNWVNTIMMECSENNELHIQYVYEHVSYALQELHSDSPMPIIIQEFLEERKQIYAETSP